MGFQKGKKEMIAELVDTTNKLFNAIGENNIIHKVKLVFAGTPESDSSIVGIQYYVDNNECFHLVADSDNFGFGWSLYEAFISFFAAESLADTRDIYLPDENGNVTRETRLVA